MIQSIQESDLKGLVSVLSRCRALSFQLDPADAARFLARLLCETAIELFSTLCGNLIMIIGWKKRRS